MVLVVPTWWTLDFQASMLSKHAIAMWQIKHCPPQLNRPCQSWDLAITMGYNTISRRRTTLVFPHVGPVDIALLAHDVACLEIRRLMVGTFEFAPSSQQ